MKRLLSLSVAVFQLSSLAWATEPLVVTTDEEIRAAVQTDGANIQLGERNGRIYNAQGVKVE